MLKTRYIRCFVFLLGVTLHLFACEIKAQEMPRTYLAQKSSDKIIIDGLAEESTWKTANWTADFIDIEGEIKPKYKTQMKMAWDDLNLYFYVKMEEPHVWGTLKERDTVIFYNNDFEVFIDPNGDSHNYLEFEMNALNTVWDLWLTKPYRNGPKVIDGWDIQGLKTAVKIEGTLNNATDIDKYWAVEIAMPWKALLEASDKNQVPVNQFWRLNFSRVNWDFELKEGRYSRKKNAAGKYEREYNWVWSPQGVINMHEPEHWGYVYFTDDATSTFQIPKDDKIKRHLYVLARKLWSTKESVIGAELKQQIETAVEINGQKITPVFEAYKYGWNITAQSPFTNKLLRLNDDGKFRIIE